MHKKNESCEYLVFGHRNPDIDSLAAASGLAYLRQKTDRLSIKAAACGLPGVRAEYLFKKFNYPLPELRRSVHPCVRDVFDRNPPVTYCKKSLFSAIKQLNEHRLSRIAVLDADKKYAGMLSLFSMLGGMLQGGEGVDGESITGRRMYSSLQLIQEVLSGKFLCASEETKEQDFEVYVAAMNVDSFREHIPREHPENLVIVVGDRSDVHLMAVGMGARLMIVTGSRRVDDVVLAAAKEKRVSILRTPFDSATVVRRLKFSSPVSLLLRKEELRLDVADRLSDIAKKIYDSHEDIFPVVGEENEFLGVLDQVSLTARTPFKVLMVDHNDFDNSVPGIESVPVVEIVDHHRFSMPPLDYPIKITCDTVGSSCTLVTELFRSAGVEIPPSLAGVMLGGVITDTLLLHSPTATERDKYAIEYLSKIAGVDAKQLHGEIFKVGSLIARMTPEEALNSDRKNFNPGKLNFAVSQIEEASFDEFFAREKELRQAAEAILKSDKLDAFALLVTDVVKENSLMMIVGDSKLLWTLPYRKIRENLYDLPGVLSRKKQLLPELLKDFQPYTQH